MCRLHFMGRVWIRSLFLTQTPIHPFADAGLRDFGGPLEQTDWLGAITIERENLQKWYAKVLEDPANLDKYRRIEQARLAKHQPKKLSNDLESL